MTSQRRTPRYRPLFAVLSLFALVAVACGSGTASVASVAADRTAEAPAAAPDPAVESTAGGHAYGTSIDDWVASPTDAELAQESAAAPVQDDADADQAAAPSIEWNDLIPPGLSGEEVVARYREKLDAVEAGSAEAEALYDEMIADFDPEAVNFDLDGQRIRLAGFVAPLTYDGDLVTEFLLVPTFGACVHVPPPPPNQTIMVAVDEASALTIDDTYGAVWVEGTLTIAAAETDLATASYTFTNATSGVYNDF